MRSKISHLGTLKILFLSQNPTFCYLKGTVAHWGKKLDSDPKRWSVLHNIFLITRTQFFQVWGLWWMYPEDDRVYRDRGIFLCWIWHLLKLMPSTGYLNFDNEVYFWTSLCSLGKFKKFFYSVSDPDPAIIKPKIKKHCYLQTREFIMSCYF
jgi:hypothetical protein